MDIPNSLVCWTQQSLEYTIGFLDDQGYIANDGELLLTDLVELLKKWSKYDV